MNWNKDKHRSFIRPTKSNHRSLAGNIHLPDRVLITSGSAVLHHRDNFIVILQRSNAFTYQLRFSLFLSLIMRPYRFQTFKLHFVVSRLRKSDKLFYFFFSPQSFPPMFAIK